MSHIKDPYEKTKIADCIELKTFNNKDVIIAQVTYFFNINFKDNFLIGNKGRSCLFY